MEDYKVGLKQREVVKKHHMRFSRLDVDGSGVLEREEASALGDMNK